MNAKTNAKNQPNILLITTDQQRYDASGSGGPSFLKTPHFNHLCREGVEFHRAYGDCPVCGPSRASIMTGKQVFNHGMVKNGNSNDHFGSTKTLPYYMREQGYQTLAVGKMHFTPQRNRHGFDEMLLPDDYYRSMQRSGCLYQPMRNGLGQNELYPAMATVPESLTLTSWIAEQCVDFIRDRRDPTVPFFLWCSFSKPHPPLDPPEPYYSMYRQSPIPGPVFGDWSDDERCPEAFKRLRQKFSFDLIPEEIICEAKAAYYGLITQIDYNMGRIFAALMDKGIFDNTLIVYTSDHGEYLGDHHCGGKGYFHESSAHVPFVLRMPKTWDHRCHGMKNYDPITLADIVPTLVAAAGGDKPEGTDGQDLIAVARGELKPREYLEAMYSMTTIDSLDYTAITDGKWKYIYYPEGGVEQLFNIDDDKHELVNMANISKFDEIRDRLKQELVSRHRARSSSCVDQDGFVVRPLLEDLERDRRNTSFPGYHTDYLKRDVRH